VAPVAWLAEQAGGVATALDWLAARPREFAGDTGGMELLTRAPDPSAEARRARADDDLRDADRRVLKVLAERPMSRAELAERVGTEHWTLLSTARLEDAELLQPAGLTPTDLLHVGGQFVRWDADAARRLSELTARSAGRDEPAFRREALTAVARRLAIELLKKHLDAVTDPDLMDDCPACQAMLENLLAGGGEHFAVRVHMAAPLVGIGAPAEWFLRRAAELLDARIVIPPHAEVANAIGAATSDVVVRGQVAVRPAEEGGYLIDGLPGRQTFARLGEAHAAATAGLREQVLRRARAAGTASQDVRLTWDDHLATAADGTELFLERRIRADLAGQPNVSPRE
jgi:N-methylhydantoinase A/oxoprolinase/acetone carboxylase beta subunit